LVRENGSTGSSRSIRVSVATAQADSWWQMLVLHGATAAAST